MKKQIINTNQAPSPIGPYNQSVQSGPFLFISGQLPMDMESGEIEQDIEKATHIVMKYLKEILAASSLTFEDVVKVSIFLANMDDFTVVNGIYAQYFNEETAPAREAIAVKELPRSAPIEISLIAAVR